MIRLLVIVMAGLAVLAGPAFSQEKQAGETDKAENCDGGTYQLLECMEAQRAYWDKQLGKAYKDALDGAEPGQKPLLREAERAWIKFRDANCDYYAAGEGSIAKVSAIWCVRDMTEKRAKELAGDPYE